tara:strand:+ start:5894 stop:6808 length:915 start_codon:yes stop_codon:yes gene_type:complete
MNILMLGGTGLIGPHVILGMGGHVVTTLTRSGKRLLTETNRTGNRHTVDDISAAIRTSNPDLIIDMIPFTRHGAQALVDAIDATQTTAHVIALSSIDVYAAFGSLHGTEPVAPQSGLLHEDAALRQMPGPDGDAYDKTGIEAIYCDALPNLTILRMPVVYGWPDCTRVKDYLDPMLDGAQTITIATDVMPFQISRTSHQNAAAAVICAALARQKGQHIFNVAEPVAMSERQWAQQIAQVIDWTGGIITGPPRGDEAPIQNIVVDTAKIRRELGYHEPHDPAIALRDNVLFHAHQRMNKPYIKGY